MEENKHIVKDSTSSTAGSRIPTYTYFETVWSKDIKLLQYFVGWQKENNMKIQSLDTLEMQDKLAIARHKKILKKRLGLIKEPIKVKVIYWSTCPTNFFTDLAVEKEKTFQTSLSRWDKRYCVLWTKEKAELIMKYQEVEKRMDEELNDIKDKIMDKNTSNTEKLKEGEKCKE